MLLHDESNFGRYITCDLPMIVVSGDRRENLLLSCPQVVLAFSVSCHIKTLSCDLARDATWAVRLVSGFRPRDWM